MSEHASDANNMGSATTSPRVVTFAPADAFLPRLASAVLNGELPASDAGPPDALHLAITTILLPTRRAARALAEAFLDAAGANAMLLPKIRPITGADADMSLLSPLGMGIGMSTAALNTPPAISDMERRLVLTRLVLHWGRAFAAATADAGDDPGQIVGARTPAQATHLAAELARLMDLLETFNVDLDAVGEYVPDTFSRHWQLTLEFLKIATTFWPDHLAERGLMSPAGYRIAELRNEAARLQTGAHTGPVIAAGITGLEPATTALLHTIARLPDGAVVLPGLDVALDDASWAALAPPPAAKTKRGHPEHAQYELRTLLDRLKLSRSDVAVLPTQSPSADVKASRTAFISEAMRPASTTERWHGWTQTVDRAQVRAATANMHLIEAATAAEEAEVIALMLRRCAEDENKTAALITPDRLLARRVGVRLESWGIRVDDSAGRPFAKTVPGAFLELIIDCVAKNFAPAPLMALLKHPLCRLGRDPFDIRRAARALEISTFRTIYLGTGLEGAATRLANARDADASDLTRTHNAARRLWDEDLDNAADLIAALKTAFEPLKSAFSASHEHDLASLAAAHAAVAENLARTAPASVDEDSSGTPEPSPLYAGEAGTAAASLFSGLLESARFAPDMSVHDYPDFYRSLTAGQNVRPSVPLHPRLFIWGPLEARLQHTDVVIMGSLNEGTWPEIADPGPWLNRPLRASFALPSPEQSLGNAAHDFTTQLMADTVYLTRAQKVDGVPTVRSRWLMRIMALLQGIGLSDALEPDAPWLSWARTSTSTAVTRRQPIAAPAPRPPIALRPRRLSVSDVETWIANPYALYARKILKLAPLPTLGAAPDAGLKGSIVHAALARFTSRYAKNWPQHPLEAMMAIARDTIEDYAGNPRVAAFWLPRIARFAEWFVATEPERRNATQAIFAEVSGAMVLAAPAGDFKITARADRIDKTGAGLIIADYKTGQAPTDKRVNAGFAPQLPLEAAIAERGGFEGIDALQPVALRYIRATGGEPAGVSRDVKTDDVAKLGNDAADAVSRLIALYDDTATPYAALQRAEFASRPDDYAHLARFAEWSAGADGED